jgi:hypothetical protein
LNGKNIKVLIPVKIITMITMLIKMLKIFLIGFGIFVNIVTNFVKILFILFDIVCSCINIIKVLKLAHFILAKIFYENNKLIILFFIINLSKISLSYEIL